MAADVWILTGPSGAGKASALSAFADSGAECVDNLPVDLLEGFLALPRGHPAVAVIDARQNHALERIGAVQGGRVLFLDARDDVLVRRLNDRVRPHLASLGRGLAAIQAERELLAPLRGAADVVVDTSELQPAELHERVRELVAGDARALTCTVSSFGYKYGPQLEADWVADSRVMANPFWVPELRPLTGLDQAVRDYVLEQPEAGHLLDKLTELMVWNAERAQARKRLHLHLGIGCTGGRHRSVVIAEELSRRLRDQDLQVSVRHRDVRRADPR